MNSAMPSSIEDALATAPCFRGLSGPQLRLLACCALRTSLTSGELLFREGDLANRFYLIERGRVLLEARTTGTPIPIQTVEAGDVLGWSWLFPPHVWHFDARALEPVDLIFFYGTRLRQHCDEDPALG